MDTNTPAKKPRGFATMTPERRSQIASLGGKAVPAEKRSFALNPELASRAGRKGGMAVPAELRFFSRKRENAAEAGRKGAAARDNS